MEFGFPPEEILKAAQISAALAISQARQLTAEWPLFLHEGYERFDVISAELISSSNPSPSPSPNAATPISSSSSVREKEKKTKRRIRVGYVVAPHSHPVGKLINSVFQHHNKENFEVFAFPLNKENSTITIPMREALDSHHYIPLDGVGLREGAKMIYDLGIEGK
jgi:hypothetical protein